MTRPGKLPRKLKKRLWGTRRRRSFAQAVRAAGHATQVHRVIFSGPPTTDAYLQSLRALRTDATDIIEAPGEAP